MQCTTIRLNNQELDSAVSSMRGRRFTMEDKHILDFSFMGNCYLFAVFDGHGGENVANYCEKQFKDVLLRTLTQADLEDNDRITEKLKQCFITIDLEIFQRFNNPDQQEESGTTANCAIVTPQKIIVANCGDSRCVLGTNGLFVELSHDHKPTQKAEKLRIKEAGGIVILGRVNGDLAVSRALGDLSYKNKDTDPTKELVSCIPDIKIHDRTPNDEVLLLACDGVWDVMRSSEAVEFFKEKYIKQRISDIGTICEDIIKDCYERGSSDNMTLIGIKLPGLDPNSRSSAEGESKQDDVEISTGQPQSSETSESQSQTATSVEEESKTEQKQSQNSQQAESSTK